MGRPPRCNPCCRSYSPVSVADFFRFGGGGSPLNSGYTISSDSWAAYTASAAIGIEPYAASLPGLAFALGHDSGANADLDEYNVTGDSWTECTSGPDSDAVRWTLGIDGKLYRGGSLPGPTVSTAAWDPGTDSWTSLALPPYAASYQTVKPAYATDGTDGYTFGGTTGDASRQHEVYAYRVAGDAWSALTDMPRNRAFGTAFSNETDAFVMGGIGPASAAVNENDIYSYAGDTWSLGTSLPTVTSSVRAHPVSAYKGGDGYVMGQQISFVFSSRHDKYGVSGDSWTAMEQLPNARQMFVAAP